MKLPEIALALAPALLATACDEARPLAEVTSQVHNAMDQLYASPDQPCKAGVESVIDNLQHAGWEPDPWLTDGHYTAHVGKVSRAHYGVPVSYGVRFEDQVHVDLEDRSGNSVMEEAAPCTEL